jgi:hypothetical protein
MNQFQQWYLKNQTQITWFLMGFLVYAGLQDLSTGDYFGAAISFGLVWLNYRLS